MSNPQFIYIISSSSNGPVKIGISDDPDRRLRQLQTGHPTLLAIHHREPVEKPTHARMLERFIHDTLSPKRMIGEWFNIGTQDAIGEVRFATIRWESDPLLESRYRRLTRR